MSESAIVQKIKQLQQSIGAKTQSDVQFQDKASKLVGACATLAQRAKGNLANVLQKAAKVVQLQDTINHLSQELDAAKAAQASDLQALGQLDSAVAALNDALKTQDLEQQLTQLNTTLQDLDTRLQNSSGASGGARRGGYSYRRKRSVTRRRKKTKSKSRTRSRTRSRTKSRTR